MEDYTMMADKKQNGIRNHVLRIHDRLTKYDRFTTMD